MCTVIAISLIFIERGKKEEKNESSNFFLLQQKVLCKIRQQLDKKHMQ